MSQCGEFSFCCDAEPKGEVDQDTGKGVCSKCGKEAQFCPF